MYVIIISIGIIVVIDIAIAIVSFISASIDITIITKPQTRRGQHK